MKQLPFLSGKFVSRQMRAYDEKFHKKNCTASLDIYNIHISAFSTRVSMEVWRMFICINRDLHIRLILILLLLLFHIDFAFCLR